LIDQRAVVGKVAFGNVDLGFGRLGLLLGLARACEGFRGLNPGDDLPGFNGIAFAQRQALQFAGHPGLDDGRVHRPEGAGDRQFPGQCAGFDLNQIRCRQFDDCHAALRRLRRQRFLLRLAA
jgi:hypothetical protein